MLADLLRLKVMKANEFNKMLDCFKIDGECRESFMLVFHFYNFEVEMCANKCFAKHPILSESLVSRLGKTDSWKIKTGEHANSRPWNLVAKLSAFRNESLIEVLSNITMLSYKSLERVSSWSDQREEHH